MGMMTNITIQNDDLHEIMENPEQFVQELMRKINSNSERQKYGLLTVNTVKQSNTTSIIAVGGNHSTVLGYSSNQSHHKPEEQKKILKDLIKKFG